MAQVFECVPNVSEGRDEAIILQIADSVRGTQARLLHVDSNVSANRTVYTFVGNEPAIKEGALALFQSALELIDYRGWNGVHPCVGVVDVCPFIPLQDCSVRDARRVATSFAQQIAEKYKLPVFLYGQASASNRPTKFFRRGGYEQLRSRLDSGSLRADFGSEHRNEGSGAALVGARDVLIAYNINLKTQDTTVAKEIAKRLRSDLPSCQAIGWYIDEFGCAQVSTNILDYRTTSIHSIFEYVSQKAVEMGTSVIGSEIIGMVPEDALAEPDIEALGLSQFSPFVLKDRILVYK